MLFELYYALRRTVMKVISTKTLITRTLIYLFATLLLLALLDNAWARGPGFGPGGPGGGGGGGTDAVAAGEALFRNTCSGCHTFGYGDHLGPDLMNRNPREGWVRNFLNDPAWSTSNTGYGRRLLDQWSYVMPDFNLSANDIENVLAFFDAQNRIGPLPHTAPLALTDVEFEQTRDVYFDRCAGCHGLYRTGATGPETGEERSQWIGTDGLGALLRYGTPRGMPNFGQSECPTSARATS
jgi:nitrite reductase (NO-forming)/hydroxylamine reductase